MSDAITVAARHTGGSGTPLVLLHGATGSWRAWLPVLPALEERHRVLAPTLAGHHGGPPLTCPPDQVVTRIIDDMCRQLDEAGIDKAHLVGNSLGGWIALEMARRGRALSVVALSPAGAWELPRDLDQLLRLFRLGKRVGNWRIVHRLAAVGWVRRLILSKVHERADRMPPEAVARMFEDMAGCAVLDDLLSGARDAGPMPRFVDVDCPVRLAWAEADRTLPFARYGRPMVAAVPQAELVMMPGVGHVPMYDDPALVVRSILEVTSPVETTPPVSRTTPRRPAARTKGPR